MDAWEAGNQNCLAQESTDQDRQQGLRPKICSGRKGKKEGQKSRAENLVKAEKAVRIY